MKKARRADTLRCVHFLVFFDIFSDVLPDALDPHAFLASEHLAKIVVIYPLTVMPPANRTFISFSRAVPAAPAARGAFAFAVFTHVCQYAF